MFAILAYEKPLFSSFDESEQKKKERKIASNG